LFDYDDSDLVYVNLFVAVMMHPASVAETEETEVEMSDVENTADNVLSSDGTYADNVYLLCCSNAV